MDLFRDSIDINSLVAATERAQIVVMSGGLLILLALYCVQLLFVRRGQSIIDSQQQTIRDRTQSLELLSAQMLKKEESEKQKLAIELHEGIVQTLTAIKVGVENACRPTEGTTLEGRANDLDAILPAIRGAMEDVRGIAMGLRPSSLDDLGVLAALSWLCREIAAIHPGININKEFDILEDDVPPPLRTVIYRVAETALNRVTQESETALVRIRLMKRSNTISLAIDDQNTKPSASESTSDDDEQRDITLLALKERIALSGGFLSLSGNQWGGTSLIASWVQ